VSAAGECGSPPVSATPHDESSPLSPATSHVAFRASSIVPMGDVTSSAAAPCGGVFMGLGGRPLSGAGQMPRSMREAAARAPRMPPWRDLERAEETVDASQLLASRLLHDVAPVDDDGALGAAALGWALDGL
jgi:hypothetical protein